MEREYIVELREEEADELMNEHWVGELVRCKDCKYKDDGECVIKAGWFPVKPEWFCADGERK
ncbi:MAG: hypothetical protein J6S14_07175 [Clostridia bacterium]|nr:hypothetical protein [Clostridia bacterium]